MSKSAFVLVLLIACAPAWPLDWSLPVFTLRYEAAGGESEDPDEEDSLLPSSLRNTMSLHIKEDAGSAAFGLTLKGSNKDYFLQTGDYSYMEIMHDGSFHLGDAWTLGYLVAMKSIEYPQGYANGLSKDAVSLKAGTTASVSFGGGFGIEAALTGRFVLADNPPADAQAYVLSAGLSSRFGTWLMGVRYRGEFRLPLGSASAVGSNMYHTAGLSLQWDPGR
jgi:hypothetical protein